VPALDRSRRDVSVPRQSPYNLAPCLPELTQRVLQLLGASAAVGIATLIAILPLQTWLAAWFVKIQDALLLATDARMNLVNEILAAIRLIKFNSWERRFVERMRATRQTELGLLRTRFVAWTLQGIATSFAPVAVTCVTFGTSRLAYSILAGSADAD
jgi:hypothetical protein